MGRLRFVLFKISRLLPKKQRKPIILICSILGLFAFFNILTSMTHSPYLVSIQQTIHDAQHTLQYQKQLGIYAILIITLIGLCSYKYYSSIQTFISLLYVIILILAFLPFLLGG